MIRKLTLTLLLCLLAVPAWGQTVDTIGWSVADNSLLTDAASNTYWQARDTAGTVYTAGPNDSVTILKAWVEGFDSLAIQIWNHNGTAPTTMFFSDTADVDATSSIKTITLSSKVYLTPGNKYSMGLYSVACVGAACIPKNDAGGSDGISWDNTESGITSSYTPDVTLGASGMLTVFAIVEQYAIDTCGVTHTSTTAIDTNLTSIVVQLSYTGSFNNVDSVSMIWDDDTNPASPLGRVSDLTGLASPDTLTATSLTECTTYYLWPIVSPDGCPPDTGAMITIPTLCPSSKRTIIGAGN